MALQILDCTLRDGSHAIDYKFGRDLTEKILLGLEKAGIEWIEMGHASGLGASQRSGKPALLTDEEYIELAKRSLNRAKCGFFCSIKFGRKEEIKAAYDRGLNFIRVGADITEIDKIEDLIKYSKDIGLIVFAALMKGYAITDMEEYIKILRKLEKWGTDIATLMDSAGTMIPEDVQKYISHGKVNVNMKLGFHAHNNLQLGIANIITAIKAGADLVDVSVGGLGRSAGNAPTEILALLLEKYGWGKPLDYKILSDLNDNYIFPLIKGENRFSSEALTFGFAGFHSGFFPLIQKLNKAYPSLDYRDIILKVSEKEKVKLNEELIEKIIKSLL